MKTLSMSDHTGETHDLRHTAVGTLEGHLTTWETVPGKMCLSRILNAEWEPVQQTQWRGQGCERTWGSRTCKESGKACTGPGSDGAGEAVGQARTWGLTLLQPMNRVPEALSGGERFLWLFKSCLSFEALR